MMQYQLNIEAILTTHFPCAKDELIQNAAKMICELKQTKSCYKTCDRWQKRGHWEANFRYGMYPNEKFFICSECHEQSMEYSDYCPNCGANMQEEKK